MHACIMCIPCVLTYPVYIRKKCGVWDSKGVFVPNPSLATGLVVTTWRLKAVSFPSAQKYTPHDCLCVIVQVAQQDPTIMLFLTEVHTS